MTASIKHESPIPELSVYFEPGLERGQLEVALTGEEHHHLARVARHRVGDRVALTNGKGIFAIGRVERVDREKAVLSLETWFDNFAESDRRLTLAVGLIKPQRFDWLVEKATELGVMEIVPLRTKYSQRSCTASRVERWRRIAVAALKQCQRSVLPRVTEPRDLDAWLREVREYPVKVVAHGGAERSVQRVLVGIDQLPEKQRWIAALVGPEGGFTEEEMQTVREAGFDPVGLGPRRLRSETAALLLSSLLLNIGSMEGGARALGGREP